MNTELQSAEDLAVRAGAILLKHYGQRTSVAWKGKNDPVTAADIEASRFIVSELRTLFPGDAILCEEEKDDLRRLSNPRVWVVDPMDGTKEFIAGRGEFVVMIGLAIDGEARLGAVYQPTEDKLYSGTVGNGAYLAHKGVRKQLHVSTQTDPARATMALSRSHLSSNTEAIRSHLGIQRSVQIGSIGIKVGLVCEGLAEVYVQGRGTSLWDTCGPEAIIHAAGGRMTDATGQPFRYNVEDVKNVRGVVATNSLLHDRAVQAAIAVTRQSGGR